MSSAATLLNAPASGLEVAHGLRLAVGNGLRGDIWEAFAERFAIPQILEFYAATEGNFSLFNVEGKPGAIGRIPPLLAHRFPASIVKVDADSGSPVRGDDGLCIACAPGEVGEAVGRIGTADRAAALSRATRTRPRPRRRSCATSLPKAMPGSAPAI